MYSGSEGTYDDEYIRYVLEEYSAQVIRLCFSYVKNMHDAEDMAEDVFCELVRKKPHFESREHEKAWLFRAAANRCKNHLHSGWVRKTVPLEENIVSGDISPEDGAKDRQRLVFQAVTELPEKYRTVIHMFYYSGLSIREIANIRKQSAATVGTHLSRGRAILKKKLGGDF